MTASPEEVTWHCPYCDATWPTLREIQQHITESTEGDHEGISGESPDEDLIATNETGDKVDIYEAADVVRPQDAPLEGVSKRKQIVYAWLANDRKENVDALAAVTDADADYARQILGQIRRSEITQDYWADEMDDQLLAVMEERIKKYDQQSTGNNQSMSTQQEETDEMDDPGASGVPAKDIILNTYAISGEDINRKQAWEALRNANILDTGYEYFRRTYKEATEGEHDVDGAIDEQVQSVIEPVLFDAGLLDTEPKTEESSEETDSSAEASTVSRTADSSASTDRASRSTGRGKVSVEDIEEIKEKVELLREQAEYEGRDEDSAAARRAEFISMKTVEWLDELINQADQ